jgi:hypothetical protein
VTATQIEHLPPISVLFASFLGYDPATSLIPPHVIANLPAANAAAIRGNGFFSSLSAGSFQDGLHLAFMVAMLICLIGAAASWSRGAQRIEEPHPAPTPQQAFDG